MCQSRSAFFWTLSLGLLSASAPLSAADDFAPLFNGKDLSGWIAEGTAKYKEGDAEKAVWTAADGEIHCAGKGFGFLRYDQKLGDFVVRLQYNMSKGCNSGVGIRGVKYTGKAETRPSFASYELQILDDGVKPPGTHSTMSLYRYVAPKKSAAKSAGQWNTLEVECRGPKIKITLNGEVVQDVDQSTMPEIKTKPLSGYLSLQNHGKAIRFRKIEVRELKKDS